MAIDPVTLTAIGEGLGALSGWLTPDKNKKLRQRYGAMLPGLEGQLLAGPSQGDISGIQGSMIAGAQPMINSLAAGYSSRLGQSGYAKGALFSKYAKTIAPLIADLQRWRLGVKNQNLESVYRTAASGAMA